MSETLPLLTHADMDAPIAYRAQRRIAVREFLADVARLQALLPAGKHVLNVCADRYRFMVGLAAAMCAQKISLLPSTHTPESVRQMCAFAPDVFCLSDRATDIDLPALMYPQDEVAAVAPIAMPHLCARQIVACVFTSGSTGAPVPHVKYWGDLVHSVRAEAQRLPLHGERAFTLVGTVPPQHMYGFESTVLLAMQGGAALWAGKPFYAADVAAALASVPPPRVLVSTPFHLRALADAQIAWPAVRCVLSATAPLSADAARLIESVSKAPLLEIYGCTESGQIASRRTALDSHWQLFDGLRLWQDAQTTFVAGDFIAGEIALGDIITLHGDARFTLHGRSSDLINIAGKRTSLGFLNHQLLAIDGVQDGVFFLPEEREHEAVGRLVAFVVAPQRDRQAILQALRERIDPLFLPRPLLLVPQLPRNAAGKLPRAELTALWQRERAHRLREGE